MPAELGTRPIGGPVLFILAVVAGLIWVLLFVRRRLAH